MFLPLTPFYSFFCFDSTNSPYVSSIYQYDIENQVSFTTDIKSPDNIIQPFRVDSDFSPSTYTLSNFNNHANGINLNCSQIWLFGQPLQFPYKCDILYFYYNSTTSMHVMKSYNFQSVGLLEVFNVDMTPWLVPTCLPTYFPTNSPTLIPSITVAPASSNQRTNVPVQVVNPNTDSNSSLSTPEIIAVCIWRSNYCWFNCLFCFF